RCGARIGFQYPAVELLSGILFAAVPWRFLQVFLLTLHPSLLAAFSAIWIIALELLLLMAYIDILLGIIPDEVNVALAVLGVIEVWFLAANFGIGNPSFFGMYAAIGGLQGNIWLNHVVGALVGAGFFGGLIAITRGK